MQCILHRRSHFIECTLRNFTDHLIFQETSSPLHFIIKLADDADTSAAADGEEEEIFTNHAAFYLFAMVIISNLMKAQRVDDVTTMEIPLKYTSPPLLLDILTITVTTAATRPSLAERNSNTPVLLLVRDTLTLHYSHRQPAATTCVAHHYGNEGDGEHNHSPPVIIIFYLLLP